jgi:hypothetical protein
VFNHIDKSSKEMLQRKSKLILIFLGCTTLLRAQVKDTDSLLSSGELKMTFPSIYFKHNSTDYATMPYPADSCFKYMALHIKDVYSFDIWRDIDETEELTNKRIKKLKEGLNKYTPSNRIEIHSMGDQQKISRKTVERGVDNEHIEYLLSLNSSFDISKSRFREKQRTKIPHEKLPRLWCIACWKHGFHIEYRRNMRKAKKIAKKKEEGQ